ncbi:probable cyclic nucleotide-binding protein [Crocosphaera subtropica ATCC 51142]|uniref:Probable cyclic nucleotide-binding protein n=1 Tax=Crocosphaera subtropica (strain ATCC 51142 / BH68) TaxID=43989 RepID=B1WXX5_CROS5|nr:Crp/Fnr family transcriptional regulator [Crocosphaera subtropica]ACB50962.1 probable cyclic nucleotide-binding protein [Crocosphaera subtropica ATCC 51142]
METQAIVELFPLFSAANPETLEWILSVVDEESYGQHEEIIKENDWGKAVYFIVSGWVKVRSRYNHQETVLEILGKGDFFGEMEVLDESLKYIDVIALSDVQLLSISAQRFLQMLFKDPQIHHKMLQLSVRRVRHLYRRFQLHQQTPKIKLIKTLMKLAEAYGKLMEEGAEILQIPDQDLADIADISLDECQQIITQLQQQGCLESDSSRQVLFLTNLKQLNHFAKQI